jgi:hypothetical protein
MDNCRFPILLLLMAKPRIVLSLIAFGLAGAAPYHVQTAQYYSAYVGIPAVPLDTVGRWVTWAETDPQLANELSAVGIKTMIYTNPNRTLPGQPEYSNDESTFAHDCSGNRIATSIRGRPQYLMDPHSPDLAARWKSRITRYTGVAHIDAVFNDDAADVAYMPAQPCGYNAQDWIAATNAMQASLGIPVIYNGLGVFNGRNVSQSIALNATAIGGMAESCYGNARISHAIGGWKWRTMEQTELLMAKARKLFFCYVNDTGGAATLTNSRLYVYASFLLTYDPNTSILWEHYATQSNFHIMPEVALVPLDPKRREISSIDDLRQPTGNYERVYQRCFLQGRYVGECLVAVNPDPAPHRLDDARFYQRSLQLSGAGIVDGGTATIVNGSVPAELGPLSAVIAFR